jgi:formylglycine-generating enzyme
MIQSNNCKRFFFRCLISYVLWLCCVPRDNQYDPENPGFIMPQFSCTMYLLDDATRVGVDHARIAYVFNNKVDSIAIDSGNTAQIRIEKNIAVNKITVRILRIESATHLQTEPFTITLSRDGRDTTVYLRDRRAQSVLWDTLATYADSGGVRLVWRASNADQFTYYLVVRNTPALKIADTLAEIVNKQDTFFFDRLVRENEVYTYRVYVISSDGSARGNGELAVTMPNRSPSIPKIIEIKGDFFIYLRIRCEKNNNLDFKRSVIYRSADSLSFFPVYTTNMQDDTVWLDTTIDKAAHRYYYFAEVIDKDDLSSVSAVVSGVNRATIEQGLVYIHQGPFSMGRSSGGTDVPLNQQPMHSVMLSSYLIDRYEVTVNRYVQFLNDANGSRYADSMATIGIMRDGSHFSFDPSWANHPMTWLSWSDADAFCKWSGGKLPTEAQWEKAARGDDKRLYPWGQSFYYHQNPPDFFLANYIAGYITVDDSGYSNDGARYTAPIGNYATGVSPYGLYDMSGNVGEWCNDWYANVYPSDTVDPQGPPFGLWRSYRGGSFKNYPEELTATYRFRFDPSARKDDVGCRCVYFSHQD